MSIELNKLGHKALAELAKALDEQTALYQENKLKFYTPHAKQDEFHRSDAKVRVFLGGNRCIREDQKIVTKDGLKSIGDMRESQQEVLSFDQKSNQFVWSQASRSFPKGKNNLYRVVHSEGEFFADGSHLVFSAHNGWKFVSELCLGEQLLFSHHQTNLGHSPLEFLSDDQSLSGTTLNSKGDYLKLNHLYGQQPQTSRVACQEFFEQHNDANKSFSSNVLLKPFLQALQVLREYVRNHFDKYYILFGNSGALPLFLDRCDSVLANQTSTGFFPQIFGGSQFVEQFLLTTNQVKKFLLSGFPSSGIYSYSNNSSISTIESIEKQTRQDWYWDIQVHGTNCYVTEDGSIHHNSGKTTASVIEAIWLCLGIHPYHKRKLPLHGKLYADSFPMLMSTFYVKFKDWLHPKFLAPKKPYIYNQMGHLIQINFANTSKIDFGSYDQEERKAEGAAYDFIGFDEPPSRYLYVANMRSLIDRKGLMWFTCTLLSELWIYEELFLPAINGDKPHIKAIQASSYDNPHTDPSEIDLFASELTDEERRVRVDGEPPKLQGVVMDTYSPRASDVDPIELNDSFVIYEGHDPHSGKPNCSLWKAIDTDGIRYVIRELKCDKGIRDWGFEIADVREELRQTGARIIGSVIDNSINQKDLRTRTNQYSELKTALRDAGEYLVPQLANKRGWLDAGIRKLKDLYRPVEFEDGVIRPSQYIFKSCRMYKRELATYVWPENFEIDGKKPIAKNDDLISCDRYIESLAPEYRTPGQAKFFRYTNEDAYKKRKIS